MTEHPVISMTRDLWNHWFWVTYYSWFLALLCAGWGRAESLRVEVLRGEAEVTESGADLKGSDPGYMPGEDNRDIDREQLGREVPPVMDKLARVNSGGVEPQPAIRKLGDPALQPTRAGKSLSQRPVTIQVKPQDISIIFRRPGSRAQANDRKPQISEEKLSRIFKFDIYDSRNLKVVSEARRADTEPEVYDNAPPDMFLNQTDDKHKKIVSNVDDPTPVKSDARELFANKTELPLQGDKKVKEVASEIMKKEGGIRKPEGRSLDLNTTKYKYYAKDSEVIKKEVVEENATKTNLIHKAVVINRPLYDHNHRVGQLSSSEAGGSSSLKRSLVAMSQSNLVGLGLGVLLFLLTLAVLIGLVVQKTDYLKKTESMEKGFVCPYNQRDNPAWITQGSSLGDRWTMGQDIKSSSHEDLHSLDNDSFLNSLEAITTCEYWPDRSWNS